MNDSFASRETLASNVPLGPVSDRTVRGAEKDYRSFPFHAIWKRIRDREQGFFTAIYISLEQAAGRDWAATDAL